jgi:hypothetical protein
MVMVSGPASGPAGARSQPSDGLENDAVQGEIVVLPLRFVVAPDHGRFHPTPPPAPGGEPLPVAPGTLIGEVRNGTAVQQVRSPFGGHLDAWLAWAGQIVVPGQPVCSLRPGARVEELRAGG